MFFFPRTWGHELVLASYITNYSKGFFLSVQTLIYFQINELQENINNTIEKKLEQLQKLFQRHRRVNQTLQTELQKLTNMAMTYTGQILSSVKIIDTKAQRVDLSKAVNRTKEYGYWR